MPPVWPPPTHTHEYAYQNTKLSPESDAAASPPGDGGNAGAGEHRGHILKSLASRQAWHTSWPHGNPTGGHGSPRKGIAHPQARDMGITGSWDTGSYFLVGHGQTVMTPPLSHPYYSSTLHIKSYTYMQTDGLCDSKAARWPSYCTSWYPTE